MLLVVLLFVFQQFRLLKIIQVLSCVTSLGFCLFLITVSYQREIDQFMAAFFFNFWLISADVVVKLVLMVVCRCRIWYVFFFWTNSKDLAFISFTTLCCEFLQQQAAILVQILTHNGRIVQSVIFWRLVLLDTYDGRVFCISIILVWLSVFFFSWSYCFPLYTVL